MLHQILLMFRAVVKMEDDHANKIVNAYQVNYTGINNSTPQHIIDNIEFFHFFYAPTVQEIKSPNEKFDESFSPTTASASHKNISSTIVSPPNPQFSKEEFEEDAEEHVEEEVEHEKTVVSTNYDDEIIFTEKKKH